MSSSVLALIPQSQINPALPGHPRSPRVLFGFVFGWPLLVFFRLVTTLFVLQTSVGRQLLLDNNYANMSYVLGTPRELPCIEMRPRSSSSWRGVGRLCGMYKFTTNPSCGWDVNKTEVPCWEISTLSAR